MMMNKPTVSVVCAVIHNQSQFLACQRGPHRPLENLWEFPGGKIEVNETPEAAIIREIDEELHCRFMIESNLLTVTHEYDDFIMILTAFIGSIGEQKPMLSVHRAYQWVDIVDLKHLDFALGDRPIISYLEINFEK